LLEQICDADLIDLYYGDECRVSLQPNVPYGWQFADEDVFMPSSHSPGLNCFGLLSKGNDLIFETTTNSITADFIAQQLDQLSLNLNKDTVVVLDNAKVHTAKLIQDSRPIWEARGLTLFFLPPYSPQLNLIEILWRQLKYFWLRPQDYLDFASLCYAVTLALAAVGTRLIINFASSLDVDIN
jgi:transposase